MTGPVDGFYSRGATMFFYCLSALLALVAVVKATPEAGGFRYSVNDYNGNEQSHQQNRVGNAVNGQYKVLLPDGRLQTVTYIADEAGYRAKVDYTPALPGEATTAGEGLPQPAAARYGSVIGHGGFGAAGGAYGAGAFGGSYGGGAIGPGFATAGIVGIGGGYGAGIAGFPGVAAFGSGFGAAGYGNGAGYGAGYGAIGTGGYGYSSPIYGALGYNPIGYSAGSPTGYSYGYSTPFSQVYSYSNILGGGIGY